MILDRGTHLGESSKPDKLLFISDYPDQGEVTKWGFEAEVIQLNFVGETWYLGLYIGPREELEE